MAVVELVTKDELGEVDVRERVLLLPHCLRPSETCPGKYSKQGLICPDDCHEDCAIRLLREAAMAEGFKGVCVAPGGSMVLRFVEQMLPKAILAVACQKELDLGIAGVEELVLSGRIEMPLICVVPLSRDGCVDTEVDVAEVIDWIQT